MLNCFFWYSIIWAVVILLYAIPISNFNTQLNGQLFIFLLFTIMSSFIMGLLFRDKFKYSDSYIVDNQKLKKSIIIISFSYFLEFIVCKTIPFLSVVINKSSLYGDFTGIPIFHVIISAYTLIMSFEYFQAFLSSNYNRKYFWYFFLTLFLNLLVNSRSRIIISIFGAILLYIAHLNQEKKLKINHYLFIVATILLIGYLNGGLGNIRDGYTWNDNSYIERLGMYSSRNFYFPKQYMWTYSYLTSPLANLNYNINNLVSHTSIIGIVSELVPRTIAKLFLGAGGQIQPLLIRSYFNAVTGWLGMYIYGGFKGMYILYIALIIISLIVIYLSNLPCNKPYKNINYVFICILFVFMFFYNTLSTVLLSWGIWIILFRLIPIRLKKK
jgi:hypothetical protein